MRSKKKKRLRFSFWQTVAFVLGAVLLTVWGMRFLGGSGPSGVSGSNPPQIGKAISAKELYQDFVCFCCGQSIGECTCGEAKEKRRVVDELLEGGSGKKRVYKEMVKKYGEEILFDKALAAEMKRELIAEAPADRPIIVVEPETINLGEVLKKSVVSRDFKIKNEGKQNLVIQELASSCGCTTAQVINQGVEGPIFGMEGHDGFKNPKGWSTKIEAGEEAVLRVFYDPTVHKDLTGPVTRTVTVFSNDPINAKIKAVIELEQR